MTIVLDCNTPWRRAKLPSQGRSLRQRPRRIDFPPFLLAMESAWENKCCSMLPKTDRRSSSFSDRRRRKPAHEGDPTSRRPGMMRSENVSQVITVEVVADRHKYFPAGATASGLARLPVLRQHRAALILPGAFHGGETREIDSPGRCRKRTTCGRYFARRHGVAIQHDRHRPLRQGQHRRAGAANRRSVGKTAGSEAAIQPGNSSTNGDKIYKVLGPHAPNLRPTK